jgi:hypothetical protein
MLLAAASAAVGQSASPSDTAQPATAECLQSATLQLVDLSDSRAMLARALRLYGRNEHASEFLRRGVRTQVLCADSLAFLSRWFAPTSSIAGIAAPLPASAKVLTNSAYPRDRNNGAVWNGVGVNSVMQAGVKGEWRFLSAALNPTMIYQENREFALPRQVVVTTSEFAYPFTPLIDYPIRMGPDAFSSLGLTNSYIEVGKGAFAATFSNENLWIGPTQVHALIMSNTGPGMTHLRFGTRRPVDLGIARAEFQFLFGGATESEYFGGDGQQDSRLFQATFAALEFKAIPGFHIGAVRVLHDPAPPTGHRLGYYLDRIIETPLGGEPGLAPFNRLGAFYLRWALPESGFEAYMEWGREDFAIGFESLLREPDYSQVWAAGAQKAYIGKNHVSRMYAEVAHLGQGAPTRGGRGDVQFYTHTNIMQGHTNRGQMLGASIGPGSDAQTIGYELFTAKSKTGFMLERARYDEDAYYRLLSRRFGESRHDVEITGEVSRLQWVGPVAVEALFRLSRRYDRHWVNSLDDLASTKETNFGTELSASWTPRW